MKIFKRLIPIFLLLPLLIIGCDDKFEEQNFVFYELNDPGVDPIIIPATLDGKKGACITLKGLVWSGQVARLKPFWHYSWGANVSENEPDGIEYVPMKWGGALSDDKIAELIQWRDEGKIKYLMGYNEPDNADQSNMLVDDAIAFWSKLEQVGVPLVSPSAVQYDNAWMQEFMQKADAQGLRIDYLGFHSYGGANATAFLNKVEAAYQKYGKPIWITEFAVADWNATTHEENIWTPAQVLDFMKEVLPELESRNYVFRYSWFDSGNAVLWSSALYDDNNELTALGEYYAAFAANPNAGVGKDPDVIADDPDNMLVNGNFETGELTPWLGYSRAIVSQDETEPYDGNFCGRTNSGNASQYQTIELEAGKIYTISCYSKWEATPSAVTKVIMRLDAEKLHTLSLDLPTSTEWENTTFEYECPENGLYRIVFWKGDPIVPRFYFDKVVIKEKVE